MNWSEILGAVQGTGESLNIQAIQSISQ